MNRIYSLYSLLLMIITLLLCITIGRTDTIFLDKLPTNPILNAQVELRLNRLKNYLKDFSLSSSYQELYLRAKLC